MSGKILTLGAILMTALTSQACANTSALNPSADMPPVIAAPADAQPVVITLNLTARDAEAFKAHLLNVIPVTRAASGAQYSWSTQNPEAPEQFTLIQGWDSLEQQQGYMAWRAERGDLDTFMGFLTTDPVVDVRVVFDD